MKSNLGNLPPELADRCLELAGEGRPAPSRAWPSEKAFQADVIKEAKRNGWTLIYHVHFSQRSRPGFPDLVLVRPGDRLLFVELKSNDGIPSAEQAEWLQGLASVGAEVKLWKPCDWPAIVATLERKG